MLLAAITQNLAKIQTIVWLIDVHLDVFLYIYIYMYIYLYIFFELSLLQSANFESRKQ